MFHANGWTLPFAAPAVGARLVLPGRALDGASLEALIESEGVTVAAGVPTIWSALLDHLDASGRQLPSLRRVLVGGAAVPQALLDRIEARLGVVVQTSWGMTELSPLGTIASPSDLTRDAARSGRVSVGTDLLLTDADGQALPQQRNVEGHLRVRGANVVARYFGENELATDADGWFDTGDLGVLDGDGSLRITGRSKDLIKSGGEWINPAVIEAVVGSAEGVGLVAVVARPDARWTERPVLFLEALSDGACSDDAAIRAKLAAQLPSWWIPDLIVRLPSLPVAATGKIDKTSLRALAKKIDAPHSGHGGALSKELHPSVSEERFASD